MTVKLQSAAGQTCLKVKTLKSKPWLTPGIPTPGRLSKMVQRKPPTDRLYSFNNFFLKVNIGRKHLMRTKITLACTECKQRNYNTTKDKKTHPDRMEINKYCKFCQKHTLHKETK